MFHPHVPQPYGAARIRAGLRRVLPAALAALAAASCIDRSNPFDPLNADQGQPVREQLKPRLDSLQAGEPGYASLIAGFAQAFSVDSSDNAGRVKSNGDRRSGNDATAASNQAIQAKNAKAAPESLSLLSDFLLLDTLKAYGPYALFAERRTALRAEAADLAAFMAKANADHSPSVIYPTSFSDSVFRSFARDTLAFARLQARIDSGNAAVGDTNAAVLAYNADRNARIAAVLAYNDSIAFLKSLRNRPVIAKPESLTAATFVAKPGDTLFVGSGTFTVDLRFSYSGTADTSIVVRGFPGGKTVLVGSVGSAAVLSSRANIRFEDLVFRDAPTSGIKMVSQCKNIVFRRCRFEGNGKWGLEVIDSDVEMQDCQIVRNGIKVTGGGGARIQGDPSVPTRMRLQNVLASGNKGLGMEIINQAGEIINSTISHNDSDGIRMTNASRPLSISNTILSSNRLAGIYRAPTNEAPNLFTLRECDLWDNHPALRSPSLDSSVVKDLVGGNLDVDPKFTDPGNYDYSLDPSGVLAGYERQALPVIIGYRP